MKERIDQKINDVIESILAKDVGDISYIDYKILDCRSRDLKYEEEQQKKNEELSQLMARTFGFGSLMPTSPLPEPEIKED